MRVRDRWRVLVGLGLVAIIRGWSGEPVEAQAPPSGVTTRPSLKDTLEKGLRARRPEEFQYLARVVQKVERQELPLELVMSTFQWARQKTKHANFPFPYFVRALRERAARLGLEAP